MYVYKRTRVQRVEEDGSMEKNKYEGEEEAEENVIIMDNVVPIYVIICVALYYYRRVSVIWRFSRVADKRAPPGPRLTDYTMRSRDGYNVSLRFCDRRSIFHFFH